MTKQMWLIAQLIVIVAVGPLCRNACVAQRRNVRRANRTYPTPTVCLSVVVPSYIYPAASGSAWDTVVAHPLRSNEIDRIMIVNPSSGPGADARPEYRHIVEAAQRSGNKVYGYISTRYGKVDAQTVHREIDEYIKWYKVDGIFVDEVSADAQEVARYYQPVATFITSAIRGGGVILNAGTYPDASYAAIKVPKQSKLQIVVFENSYASFTAASFTVPAWIRNYPPWMFMNIVYDAPAQDVDRVLELSVKRGVGTVYVTDQTMPDPYAALPSYWAEFDQAVQAGCVR